MAKDAMSITKCLRSLSNSELKVYLHVLENVDEPEPFKFEINLMDLCRDCDLSLPTVKSALDRLVRKGNLLFIGRRYKTAPGEYSLPAKDSKPLKKSKPQMPEEVAKSVGLEEANLEPKPMYIKEIVRNNALILISDQHLRQAKETYRRILNQEDLKDYYMEYVWQDRDDRFSKEEILAFLSQAYNGVPIKDLVNKFINISSEAKVPLVSHEE